MKAPDVLFISVTEDNISKGVQGSGLNCPIAKAIRESYGDDPFVNGGTTVVNFENGEAVYRNSWRAFRFIKRFDKKGATAVGPQKFRMKLITLTPVYNHLWGEMGSQ